MKPDNWKTIDAMSEIIRERGLTPKVTFAPCGTFRRLESLNEHGVAIRKQRIYNGDEHPKAKRDMVLYA